MLMVNKMGCSMVKPKKRILISTAVELLTEKEYESDKKNVTKTEMKIDGKNIKIFFRPIYQPRD